MAVVRAGCYHICFFVHQQRSVHFLKEPTALTLTMISKGGLDVLFMFKCPPLTRTLHEGTRLFRLCATVVKTTNKKRLDWLPSLTIHLTTVLDSLTRELLSTSHLLRRIYESFLPFHLYPDGT